MEGMIWPRAFTETEAFFAELAKMKKADREKAIDMALATQLGAWAICMSGTKPLDNFGDVIVRLAKYTGESSPDGIKALADHRRPVSESTP